MTLTEEDFMGSPFFSSFRVGGITYHSLTLEAIEAIKDNQRVELNFNTPDFTAYNMRCQQIIFHKVNEEPAYGEAYAHKCANLKI